MAGELINKQRNAKYFISPARGIRAFFRCERDAKTLRFSSRFGSEARFQWKTRRKNESLRQR